MSKSVFPIGEKVRSKNPRHEGWVGEVIAADFDPIENEFLYTVTWKNGISDLTIPVYHSDIVKRIDRFA